MVLSTKSPLKTPVKLTKNNLKKKHFKKTLK